MKLQKKAYIDYWRQRMAKGPLQAGTEEQAEEIWKKIKGQFEGIDPHAILEFGCGYGRMTKRLRRVFPDAHITCQDLSQDAVDAVDALGLDNVKTICGHKMLVPVTPVDLIFTCQVLQHVTDDDIFNKIMKGFEKALAAGGTILLFENCHETEADHMSDRPAESYVAALQAAGLEAATIGDMVLNGQTHCFIIGRKAGNGE
ncbi:MAG: class I SAM-dependent methyltransferase [Candidatus Paceibacterota bacterium]|jgi:trans-aconitate methyltransferase